MGALKGQGCTNRAERYLKVSLYKGSARVLAGNLHPCSGWGNTWYTSVPSGAITFKRVDINAPFDLVTNRIRSMPSGAGKRQCRVSVLVFCVCLTRIIDRLLENFLRRYNGCLFSTIYSDVQRSEPSIIMGREIVGTLEPSCCWRGQKSTQF